MSTRPTLTIGILHDYPEPADMDAIRFLALHAEEIVVLDTTSTQSKSKWPDVSNLVVLDDEWADSYSDARNQILRAASSDFVLMMNSDEHLGFASLKSIRESFEKRTPVKNQVTCIRVDALDDNETPLDSSYQPRLIPRHECLKYRGRIFEYLVGPDDLNFSYRDDIRLTARSQVHKPEWERQVQRRTNQLINLETIECGLDGRLRYYLGLQCLVDEQYEAAQEHFEVIIADEKDDCRVASAYVMLVEVLRKKGCAREAVQRGLDGARRYENYGELWYSIARASLEADQRTRAEAAFVTAKRTLETQTPSLYRDPSVFEWQADLGRALTLASLLRFDETEAVMHDLYERIPPGTQPEIDADFVHIWLQLNQPHRAWSILEIWLKDAPVWAVNNFLELLEYVVEVDGLDAAYAIYQKALVSYGGLLDHLSVVAMGATMAGALDDVDAQLELLTHCINLGSKDLDHYAYLSKLLAQRGRLDDAQSVAQQGRAVRDKMSR